LSIARWRIEQGEDPVITREQVDMLARLRIEEYPVTTLFLNFDRGSDRRKSEILIKDLIKQQRAELATRDLSADQLSSVEQDFDAMLKFVHNFDRKGSRAAAVFCSSGAGVWQAYGLARPVRDRLVVDAHPHLRPLFDLLHQFRRCLVLLMGRDRSVLYLAHLGELELIDEGQREVPPEVRVGSFAGYEERRLERRAIDRRHHFVRQLVERTLAEMKARQAEVIVIGGVPEMVAAFETDAPRMLRDRVIGRLGLGPEAPPAEVLARTGDQLLRFAREQAAQVVEEAIKAANAGGMGVAGVGPTLRAFGHGQVSVVVVSPRLVRPGGACSACSGLAIDGDLCPVCGAPLVQVPDVIEELVYRALNHSVEVVDVDGHPGLEAAGGMAALLRYRRPAPALGRPLAAAGAGSGRRSAS
jgi:peptide chain release factor subunit 1